MAYLQSTAFKSQLPTITSYTCYDSNQQDSFGNYLNRNCIPVVGSKNFFQCTVYAQNTCPTCSQTLQPITQTCLINPTKPGGGVCSQGELPSGCDQPGPNCNPCTTSNVFAGSCTIQNQTQQSGHDPVSSGPFVDACYLDGEGPNPAVQHSSGFYCLGWKATTYDLRKVNLQMKNLYGNNEIMGCMSPGTAMSANTRWGGLGIGSSCVAEDPGFPNTGETAILLPTYLDPVILFSNPFSNDNLSGILNPSQSTTYPNVPFPPTGMENQYSIYSAWVGFCQQNPKFCQAPALGTSTSGLAHLVGQAGPVSTSDYVLVLKKNNPKSYYTWQYDDGAGTLVCQDPTSQVLAYFCAGTQLSSSAAKAVFANASASRRSSRFAAVNNCPYDIWVQMKSAPAPANICLSSFAVNDGSDCLQKISPGGTYVYDTPEAGKQSVNLWSKTGCDATGFNCITGETGDNNGHERSYGSQPDLETKVEASFGCTLPQAQRNGCQQAGGKALIPATFYDITFVDGYTRPVSFQMIPGPEDLTNSNCMTPSSPKIDIRECPIEADLSTRPFP